MTREQLIDKATQELVNYLEATGTSVSTDSIRMMVTQHYDRNRFLSMYLTSRQLAALCLAFPVFKDETLTLKTAKDAEAYFFGEE